MTLDEFMHPVLAIGCLICKIHQHGFIEGMT
jgi:hypothetical protein